MDLQEKEKTGYIADSFEQPVKSDKEAHVVFSPTTGRIIPLQQVKDEVFMKEMVGKGVAIFPEISSIFSPVNGIVKYIPTTKHAMIVSSNDGIDVLIHIGVDTINLNGKYFETLVKQDAQVKVGDPLLHFDRKAILNLGFDLVIPVVITNTNDFSQVIPTRKETVIVEDRLIDVLK
jgi:PTS system beta-glucosides-specific IIC component